MVNMYHVFDSLLRLIPLSQSAVVSFVRALVTIVLRSDIIVLASSILCEWFCEASCTPHPLLLPYASATSHCPQPTVPGWYLDSYWPCVSALCIVVGQWSQNGLIPINLRRRCSAVLQRVQELLLPIDPLPLSVLSLGQVVLGCDAAALCSVAGQRAQAGLLFPIGL